MPHLSTQDGIDWNYEIKGEGQSLVFLHGWGVNMRIWQQQYKHFARYFKVMIIDLPGHGKSSWQKLTLEEMARDLIDVFRQLGLQDIQVVGSSFGGLLALKIFEIGPDIISKLVLVGSNPKFVRTEDYPFGLKTTQIRNLCHQLRSRYPSIVNIFFRSLFTKQERKTRRYKWIQIFRREDAMPSKDALLEILSILEKEDLRGVLNQIRCPVQFIYGREDYICPKDLEDYLKEKLPRSRFDSFEECGHLPFLIKPYEFNNVLEEFLLGR